MTQFRLTAIFAACLAGSFVFAQSVPELSGPSPDPMEPVPAAPLERFVTDDVRQMRAYPEQPPVIPHSISGYQLSVNTNRCLSCHKREYTQGSGAPMISVRKPAGPSPTLKRVKSSPQALHRSANLTGPSNSVRAWQRGQQPKRAASAREGRPFVFSGASSGEPG